MAGLVHGLLAHPLTRHLGIDDPRTTELRLRVIRSKAFLRRLYGEWYGSIAATFAPGARVLELGSGAGFLKEYIPGLITSEVFPAAGVSLVTDAQAIALADAALDGIVMTDVLHHVPDCLAFFREAARVVKPGGSVAMIEPWNTSWSRLVYQRLHHEPFDLDVREWTFPAGGPLSGANGAMPWVVFERDRRLFAERCPEWRIVGIRPMMPIAYLLSGGVSFRSFVPGWAYAPVRCLERWSGLETTQAMFAAIILTRV